MDVLVRRDSGTDEDVRPTTHRVSAAVHEAEHRVIAVPGRAWDRGSLDDGGLFSLPLRV